MVCKVRKYDKEYKVHALKLSRELGSIKQAAKELGIPKNTLYSWNREAREGRLNIGTGEHTPKSALTLAEEISQLRKEIRLLEKENKQLREKADFLEEASTFFAASRLKSQKKRG